jgi:hypothetical protein
MSPTFPRTALAAVALLLGLSLACPVAAQTPVTDALHINTNRFAWAQQYAQMYRDETNQLRQIFQQVQQLEAQLRDIREQQLDGLKPGWDTGPRDTNIERRTEDAFLGQRCGSPSGGGLLTLVGGGGGFGPGRVNAAREKQYEACAKMVRLDNRRHNFLVDVIGKIQDNDREIAKLQRDSASARPDERGRLARNSNAIEQLQAAQAAEMENAQRQLQYYAQQIEALRNDMAYYGRVAFSNSRRLDAQLVQYGTLKAALEIARSRER